MRLYLIRHGQSSNNALYSENPSDFETLRSHDPQLTDIGKKQAEAVANYLAKGNSEDPFEFTHLYVSPMIRALDTAKPIVDAVNLAPEIWVDIHEIGGLYMADGDGSKGFSGVTRQYLQDCYPNYKIPKEISENGWWNPVHGRESQGHVQQRALRVASALKARSTSKERIILVLHAAFADALIKALFDASISQAHDLFYNHYNTGISRFDMGADSFFGRENDMRMHYLNRVDHLPDDLRTW